MESPQKTWCVPVWTKRLGAEDQEPMLVFYAAAFSDLNDAVEAVLNSSSFLADGDSIGEAAMLQSATVGALGLAPGDVRMI
jgi:hypothetical protein